MDTKKRAINNSKHETRTFVNQSLISDSNSKNRSSFFVREKNNSKN